MVTPRIKQVTLRGGLRDFYSLGGDQFVFVLVPTPELASALGHGDIHVDDIYRMPRELRPPAAYYSVRSWRPEREELDLWMVLHGGRGVAGWAEQASPGDMVLVRRPCRRFEPGCDVSSFVLIADETGMCAISAVLEELPASATVKVFVEAPDASHMIDFPTFPNVEVRWVFRQGCSEGTGTLMLDTVRQYLWGIDSGAYVFGAGEREQMRMLRQHFCETLQMSPARVNLRVYWRAQ